MSAALAADRADEDAVSLVPGRFEVGYVAEDGSARRVALTDARAVRFEATAPVRRFYSRKAQRHLPGRWWSATDGVHHGDQPADMAAAARPLYRLADYLDQHGRAHRASQIPRRSSGPPPPRTPHPATRPRSATPPTPVACTGTPPSCTRTPLHPVIPAPSSISSAIVRPACARTLALLCGHLWTDWPGDWDGPWQRWTRRAEVLIPPGAESSQFSAARIFAAAYPEAVTLASRGGVQ